MANSVDVPVAIVGAGPVGLAAALELDRFGVPYQIYEEDEGLSTKPKAGTILPRSLEIFGLEGALDGILREGLRFDEVHFIDRPSDKVLTRMLMSPMADETRYPFIVNLPQSDLERSLMDALVNNGRTVQFQHKLEAMVQDQDGCRLQFSTPRGRVDVRARYIFACDGGKSTVRHFCNIPMEGVTHPERFLVADFEVDLDRRVGRQLTYLSYIFDPEEWVIFVRQPSFWRFLIPVPEGAPEPTREDVVTKVRRVVKNESLPIRFLDMGIYHVHHRTAARWQDGRVFLLGDAAHLITPVGGLGMNTGIQDANNLAWKVSWVLQHGAHEDLLATYDRERAPIARFNARNQAERNRDVMRMKSPLKRIARNVLLGWMDRSEGLQWRAAHARSLLGTSYKPAGPPPGLLDGLSAVRRFTRPPITAGDRVPDGKIWGPDGRAHWLHDLVKPGFVALLFVDPRSRPSIDPDPDGLMTYIVHRFDAPTETGLRSRSLMDPGGSLAKKLGVPSDHFVLVRPDGHVAAIAPFVKSSDVAEAYKRFTGVSEAIPEAHII
ncbi:FAD-dependent monooxygenase [Sulfobacillus harzensis]|uniref:FAD-binding monooxygenase n=1 Tax=Sulfobacillus harzensis TaxID=2729629 RepID=A0A7Y0Q414_9FIRM|nr:FAD-binding monooxygenase [Sulfobacillus harzensis]